MNNNKILHVFIFADKNSPVGRGAGLLTRYVTLCFYCIVTLSIKGRDCKDADENESNCQISIKINLLLDSFQ